jgi:hypothetical protein
MQSAQFLSDKQASGDNVVLSTELDDIDPPLGIAVSDGNVVDTPIGVLLVADELAGAPVAADPALAVVVVAAVVVVVEVVALLSLSVGSGVGGAGVGRGVGAAEGELVMQAVRLGHWMMLKVSGEEKRDSDETLGSLDLTIWT